MEECTIKAILTLDTVVINGVKVIQIPFEDILRGKISIRINQPKEDTKGSPSVLKVVEPPVQSPTLNVIVPKEIKILYPNQEDKMAQDVVDYLKEISKCWEYKTLGFQTSILKKAAKARPSLNTAVCKAYGKDGDQYLTALVKENFDYIKQCWSEESN